MSHVRPAARVATALAAAAAVVVVSGPPASAHPLGNFTTNTAAAVRVQPDRITVEYFVDLAEIPTLRLDVDDAGLGSWAEASCPELGDGLHLVVDGRRAPLMVIATDAELLPGQAGLATTRLRCALSADVAADGDEWRIEVDDRNFADRIGWREITAVGDGTTLVASDVPATSPSGSLLAYPDDRLSSPLDVRHAALTARDGGPAAAAPAVVGLTTGGDRLADAFTGLVDQRHLTVGFALVALAVAAGLGSLHGLAPGHGKTVMAAYLVGRHGTGRQAAVLGLTVAVTHTLGVLLLGALISTSETVAPEQLIPWLGVLSGLLFAGLGITLVRGTRRRHGHDHHDHRHDHDHDHDHDHHHDHRHDHDHHHEEEHETTWRSMIGPGLAGGMVPTPSALVVLLGGIALGRTWFGVVLVVGYGVGMAATLVAAGFLLLRARAWFERRTDGRAWHRLERVAGAMPLMTATLAIAGGLAIAARAAATI